MVRGIHGKNKPWCGTLKAVTGSNPVVVPCSVGAVGKKVEWMNYGQGMLFAAEIDVDARPLGGKLLGELFFTTYA